MEVEPAAAEMGFRSSSEGFRVLNKRIEDKVVEWRIIDPAEISKAL